MQTDTHTNKYPYTHTHTHKHAQIYTYTHTRIRARIHTHMHTHTHTHTYLHAYAHIHTGSHTHTQTRNIPASGPPGPAQAPRPELWPPTGSLVGQQWRTVLPFCGSPPAIPATRFPSVSAQDLTLVGLQLLSLGCGFLPGLPHPLGILSRVWRVNT